MLKLHSQDSRAKTDITCISVRCVHGRHIKVSQKPIYGAVTPTFIKQNNASAVRMHGKHSYMSVFVSRSVWFTTSLKLVCRIFAVWGTKRGSSPSDMAVGAVCAPLAGTRHLHHTLTMACIVWRHPKKRPHTRFIEKPTHTTYKGLMAQKNFPVEWEIDWT